VFKLCWLREEGGELELWHRDRQEKTAIRSFPIRTITHLRAELSQLIDAFGQRLRQG
jgi:hypothetical protein